MKAPFQLFIQVARNSSDLSDLPAAAPWAYRYMGLGSCCVFKGINDFPHCHFYLSLVYLTVAVPAAELLSFILRLNCTE